MILYRNIILLCLSLLFWFSISMLSSYLYSNKILEIKGLEKEHKIANEKFITADILSKKLNKVYSLFEANLAIDKNDAKNKEANMSFLKDLTDILEKIGIKLLQIEPGMKKKKGKLVFIPYDIQIECNYEELGEFITLLESNDRLITVDELIIKNGTEKIKTSSQQSFDQINRMTIQLSINTVTLNKSKK